MEKLDQMFPDGYAIAYSCPDGQMRFSHFDPHGNKFIGEFYQLAKEIQEP
jgi:hypothetical protein